MRTALEVFGEMPTEPENQGKLNWREYEYACVAKLVEWQHEILDAARARLEAERVRDLTIKPGMREVNVLDVVRQSRDGLAFQVDYEIVGLKEPQPEFSYQK